MVTLNIDEKTFTTLREQAAARGLTVEDWLRKAVPSLSGEYRRSADLPVQERLDRFDALSQLLEEMDVQSGGTLDDSRETIYQDRGL
ncbi:hypothetical protein SH668x_000122 [Planctomicrobium sp. SH668]|uniref:hypothetical protein n=1 Tax=Planctomicrobium sp. SH668 TaxID=3448126 RepID=UPI003F5BBF97